VTPARHQAGHDRLTAGLAAGALLATSSEQTMPFPAPPPPIPGTELTQIFGAPYHGLKLAGTELPDS
jgi:hypothetical protein